MKRSISVTNGLNNNLNAFSKKQDSNQIIVKNNRRILQNKQTPPNETHGNLQEKNLFIIKTGSCPGYQMNQTNYYIKLTLIVTKIR